MKSYPEWPISSSGRKPVSAVADADTRRIVPLGSMTKKTTSAPLSAGAFELANFDPALHATGRAPLHSDIPALSTRSDPRYSALRL